jgi:hypothetical protein
METDKKVKEVRKSEKEMEMKVEAAIEQIKILDLDLGTIMVRGNSSKGESDKILNGVRVYILGKCTSRKTGIIHTVPILLVFQCRSEKDRLVYIHTKNRRAACRLSVAQGKLEICEWR